MRSKTLLGVNNFAAEVLDVLSANYIGNPLQYMGIAVTAVQNAPQ